MAKSENVPAIYGAMGEIMREVEAIGKGRTNQAQNYKFRGIDDVYNALNPLLSKHGVFTVPEVIESKREERTNKNGTVLFYSILTMRYTFFAPDGSSVQAVVIGEGMDSGDKATNKAMAVAHKYALLQIFAVPTDEPKDPENDHHEVVRRVPSSLGGGEAKRGDGGVGTAVGQSATTTPAESSLDAAVKSELGGEKVDVPTKKHPTAADAAKLKADVKKLAIDPKVIVAWLTGRYKVEKLSDMTWEQFEELRDKIVPGIDSGSIMAVDLTEWPKPLANAGANA